MNWSDEKYVKLYTRDTLTWRAWPWQARCVWPLITRKLRLPFPGRTGTVVEPLPRDGAWPGYVRVQLDTAPDGSQGARLQLPVDGLELIEKVGQLGLFGGAR